MGIRDLQNFLESCQVEGSCVGVDLVRIARTAAQKWAKQIYKKGPHGSAKFSLVVDAECCLDRLYGGFFSDWVCGGQWNRVTTFLGQFVSSLNVASIEIVVFFNGCTEQSRTQEWIQAQLRNRHKISQVLRHLNNKGTPPPKVWWTPPCCLRPTLRMVLRNLNVPVVVTMDDHKQEVIAYCRENNCHAIVADDAEYIAFDPPRYFSARYLKLTYKGTLESKEYIISELTKGLGVTTEQLGVVAALMGNYLLQENELVELHRRIIAGYKQHQAGTAKESPSTSGTTNSANATDSVANATSTEAGCEMVRAVAWYVRSLQAGPQDLDRLAREVFGMPPGDDQTSQPHRFKQAVQYYLDGTKNGFLRYRSSTNTSGGKKGKKGGGGNKNAGNSGGDDKAEAAPAAASASIGSEPGLDTSRLASETAVNELVGLMNLNEAKACLTVGPELAEETLKDSSEVSFKQPILNGSGDDPADGGKESVPPNNNGASAVAVANGSGSAVDSLVSALQSTTLTPAPTTGANQPPTTGKHKSHKTVRLLVDEEKSVLPPVAAEITRTVSERHSKGLMSPLIYQILTQGEIKLPVLMEDETHKDFPSIQLFYRPMRQMVYAILFNLHHLTYIAKNNKDKANAHHDVKLPDIVIKEWIWSKTNPYQKPEMVRAEPLGWGVPTIQRLWFGTTVDDKRRRLRAYLTCMRSDTQLMLNPGYVPQHLLVLATVLRYIMSFPEKRVLRRHELDALIATAMDPHLPNSEFNQELQVEGISTRAVQVGALVMAGVEYALLVNDACGAPIPWLMACPWLYFDGKLLGAHLGRAATAKNLLELCSHRIPQVVKVDRMREAVLEGLYVQWARPPLLPSLPPVEAARVHSVMPAGMPAPSRTPVRGAATLPPGVRGRGIKSFKGVTTGGRLEIAGVVVGNWGPNSRLHPDVLLPPQVTSVGGLGYSGGAGRGNTGRPTYSTRGGIASSLRSVAAGKGRGNFKQMPGGKKRAVGMGKKENKKQSRGRGATVIDPTTGEVVDIAELMVHSDQQLNANSNGQETNETRRILTNSEPNKKVAINQNKNSVQQRNLSGANGNVVLVNGGGKNDGVGDSQLDSDEQFADANSITADIMCMNGGDGDTGPAVGVKAILAAATAVCKDN